MKRIKAKFNEPYKKIAAAAGILLLSLVAMFVVILAMPHTVSAADNITSHDGDLIKLWLEKDCDVNITLDDDVSWTDYNMYDREVWCTLGTGSKTIDLAGYDFDVSIYNARGRQLYLFEVADSATKFTINDSSDDGDGEVIFDAYLHSIVRGTTGWHASDYYPEHVQYRNLVLVEDGSFILNGGKLKAGRRKSEYVGYGINVEDLFHYLNASTLGKAHYRYDGYVSKMVNSVGITMTGGAVLINGGTVEGRGYRELITGGPAQIPSYWNTYTHAAAIYGTGGVLAINDGSIAGYSDAHALDLAEACVVEVRAGNFKTEKAGRVAVPHPGDEMFGEEEDPYAYMFGGGEYGSNAPLFKTAEEGQIGIRDSYLNSDLVTVTSDGDSVAASNWGSLYSDKDDVVVSPTKHGSVTLIDSRFNSPIEGSNIVWDGHSECYIYVPVQQTFWNYPWMDNYWVVVAESTKSNPEGSYPTVYMGGEKIHTPDTPPVEKQAGYVSSSPAMEEVLSTGSGTLKFDLRELIPDGVEMGESFIVDFYVCQNLQPNGTGGYTQYQSCTRAITVDIEATNPSFTEDGHPKSMHTDDATYTLTASATNAVSAFWVEEWPEYKRFDANTTESGYTFSFTPESEDEPAKTSLTVPVTSVGTYYRVYFTNEYGSIKSSICCVRNLLNSDIVDTDTELTFYTGSAVGGSLVVTGDLAAAWRSTINLVRTVTWYHSTDDGATWTTVASQANDNPDPASSEHVHCIASTPHLEFNSFETSDAGLYYADVHVDMNGHGWTYKTGTYTVKIIDEVPSTEITRIDLYGIGTPYLGEVAPSVSDVDTFDDRYGVDSLKWNSHPSGEEVVLKVPESFYEVEFITTDEYSFTYVDNKLPVYVDGELKGYATNGPGRDKRAVWSYSYSSLSNNALTTATAQSDEVIEAEPGEEIDIDLSDIDLYSSIGAGSSSTDLTASDIAFADTLPDWLTYDSSTGHATGVVPETLSAGITSYDLTYAATGETGISGGLTIMVKELTNYMTLSRTNHEHTWGDWEDTEDGMHHKRTCKTCGGTEIQDHMWGEGEEQDGVITHTCELCGATYDETTPVQGHFPLEWVDEVPATCTEEGVKGHYECIECGRVFWDEEGFDSILEEDELAIAAIGHKWGSWKDVTLPTASASGTQQRVCANDADHVETRTTFLITYDLNGGTMDGKTGTVTLVVPAGESIKLPAPTRSGYTFDYWQGSKYYAGDSYTVKESHTFTAQWKNNSASNDPGKTNNNKPRTGDNSHTGLYVTLMVASLISMVFLFFLRRRHYN